jgi:hypothetical protein
MRSIRVVVLAVSFIFVFGFNARAGEIICSNDQCSDITAGWVIVGAFVGAYIGPVYFLSPSRPRNFISSRVNSIELGGLIGGSLSERAMSDLNPIRGAENIGLLSDVQINWLTKPDDSILRYSLGMTYRLFETSNQHGVALIGGQLKWRAHPRETKGAPAVGFGHYVKLSPSWSSRLMATFAAFDTESVGDLDERLLFRSQLANSIWNDVFVSYRYTTGLHDHSNAQFLSLGLAF